MCEAGRPQEKGTVRRIDALFEIERALEASVDLSAAGRNF
jgi:hypothetical protein